MEDHNINTQVFKQNNIITLEYKVMNETEIVNILSNNCHNLFI